MQMLRPDLLWARGRRSLSRLVGNRRLVRYSLATLNLVLLVSIAWFTLGSSHQGQSIDREGVITAGHEAAAEPLDQLSSADIAVSAAIAAGLYETSGVINQADSVLTEQTIAPADSTVIAKPQTLSASPKSRRDIQEYVVQGGDTVSSIASKFSVTSDSIMWSNNLHSNALAAGVKLWIPPVGVSGIVYVVQNGDTIDSLAQKFRAGKEQIIAFNDIEITGLQTGERILIPNGQQQPAPRRSLVLQANFSTGGYNGYDLGFCTWYVAKRREQAGNPVPSNLGNASSWDDRSIAMHLTVDKSAAVGAAVVTSQRGAGHVAYVEAVNADGSIWVSEMNSHGQVSMTDSAPAGGWGKVDWKLIGAGTASGYNYIH
jgi:surface antigen